MRKKMLPFHINKRGLQTFMLVTTSSNKSIFMKSIAENLEVKVMDKLIGHLTKSLLEAL